MAGGQRCTDQDVAAVHEGVGKVWGDAADFRVDLRRRAKVLALVEPTSLGLQQIDNGIDGGDVSWKAVIGHSVERQRIKLPPHSLERHASVGVAFADGCVGEGGEGI